MLSIYYLFTFGLGQIVALPVWWYTRGLNLVLQKLADWQIVEWRRLGLWIWLRNLFTPMFHDYTIIGRGLSFVMRMIILFIRLVSLIVKFIFKIVLLVVWVCLPPLIVIGFLSSIIGWQVFS